ncbi:uncharacterized protein LAJ45_08645 [Morchella importuna]|uniref:uncharacterized protein n=1 Tax=Morchella importuna TaxID=1174673 RepID=UPI001E8E9EE8|nr:uncharacterized protein LAJ45_08645 [Morchella importuna]KAH8147167.1 hypothetical protein LAJ45_08645 [Morchella importuna]
MRNINMRPEIRRSQRAASITFSEMDIKMSAFWYWGATKGLWYRSYTSGGGIYTGRDLISGIHTISTSATHMYPPLDPCSTYGNTSPPGYSHDIYAEILAGTDADIHARLQSSIL